MDRANAHAAPEIDDQQDERLAALLCSRLCHDLVSSIGAVNNGVELLREGHQDLMLDAIELIATSGQIAARRLAYFRLAFGVTGGGARGNVPFSDARQIARQYYANGRVELQWPEDLDWGACDTIPGLPRLVLNVLFIGEEALTRGGQMLLSVNHERQRLVLSLQGRDPRIQDDHRLVLAGQVPVEKLDPRTVPLYLARQLFLRNHMHLIIDPYGPGRLDLSLDLSRILPRI